MHSQSRNYLLNWCICNTNLCMVSRISKHSILNIYFLLKSMRTNLTWLRHYWWFFCINLNLCFEIDYFSIKFIFINLMTLINGLTCQFLSINIVFNRHNYMWFKWCKLIRPSNQGLIELNFIQIQMKEKRKIRFNQERCLFFIEM